jgi:hypothetical protein
VSDHLSNIGYAWRQYYEGNNEALIKRIVAVGGDTVEVKNQRWGLCSLSETAMKSLESYEGSSVS